MDFRYVEQDLNRLQALGLPYCAVRVRRGHELLFSGERGTEGTGKRFLLYSCSKVFTVASLMRLYEEGRIALDDPVEKYLPAFRNCYVVKDGKKCVPGTVMTLRHLFTMSAGLDYNLTAPNLTAVAGKPGAGTLDIVNAIPDAPLCFEPGARYQYSLAHDVLAAVAETVTGIRFSEYLRQLIFEPLGMARTSFSFAESELAPKYKFADGVYAPDSLNLVYRLSPLYDAGGAGIVSTPDDLSLFVDCLACGGKTKDGYQLLKPETIDLMRTEQHSALLKEQNFSCPAGDEYGYALGVRTLCRPYADTLTPVGEFGWDGAAGSYELIDPKNSISVAFVTHVHGWTQVRPVFHRPLRDAVYRSILG